MNDSKHLTKNCLVALLATENDRDATRIHRVLDEIGAVKALIRVFNGEQAIEVLRGDGEYADRLAYPFPDFLLLDCRLPLLSGLGVLCWLRSVPRFERLPAIILADRCSPAQGEMLARLNAVGCSKPRALPHLAVAIERGLRAALRSLFRASDQTSLEPPTNVLPPASSQGCCELCGPGPK
jgi:CheY-like chemotaxis protein